MLMVLVVVMLVCVFAWVYDCGVGGDAGMHVWVCSLADIFADHLTVCKV